MSMLCTHANLNHHGILLSNLETHTLRRRLPIPYPLSATWAIYLSSTCPDDYQTVLAYGETTLGQYYTAAILFNGGGTPNWSCGAASIDDPRDLIVKNRWYYQGFRTWKSSTETFHEFYYDLPDQTKVCTRTVADPNYFPTVTVNHFISFGDTQWAANETLDGMMTGIKIWESLMTPIELWHEARSPWPQLPKYYGALWDIIPLRTIDDRHLGGWKVKNQRRWEFADATNKPVTSPLRPDLWSRAGTLPQWPWNQDILIAVVGGGGGGAGPTLVQMASNLRW